MTSVALAVLYGLLHFGSYKKRRIVRESARTPARVVQSLIGGRTPCTPYCKENRMHTQILPHHAQSRSRLYEAY